MSVNEYVTTSLEEIIRESENVELADVQNIVREVQIRFEVPCDYFCAGSFDSTGYDCDYYNIVWFENGKLDALDVQVESY